MGLEGRSDVGACILEEEEKTRKGDIWEEGRSIDNCPGIPVVDLIFMIRPHRRSYWH
jgi:hypothetical protein